jgi:uncharacterized protein (TIGR03086 family)
MDRYAALDRASHGFARILGEVREDQWGLPSINPGWSVRDLVNHVVGGNRRYVLLLSGAPTVDVEALRGLNHLGPDARQSFRTTAADVAAAFRGPGRMEVTVHHRLGDRTGADLLVMRVLEHALHGWDLARSIETDDTIDADVVTTLLSAIDADPTLLRRSSYPAAAEPSGLDGQHRLLVLTGRAE